MARFKQVLCPRRNAACARTMKPPTIPFLFAAAMLALASAPVANAERTFAVDAEFFHDSNLTRAQYAADVRADGAARLNAEAREMWARVQLSFPRTAAWPLC